MARTFVVMLAVVLAGCQPSGGNEIDFPSLIRTAQSYGIAFPPKDSPLVLAYDDLTTLTSNSSSDHDPGIYRPAFLIEKLPDGKARVLKGWSNVIAESDAKHRPSTRPYTLRERVAPLGFAVPANNLTSFITAIQLAERGETDEANKLWQHIAKAEYFDDPNPLEGAGRLRKNPRLLLARCIYEQLYKAAGENDSDFSGIHAKASRLKKEFPELFSDDPKEFYPHRKTRFVADLYLAVSAEKPAEGSIESLLVQWTSHTSEMQHLGYFSEHNVDSDRSAREIFRQGVQAIQELSKLQNDQRLTRQRIQAFMKSPETYVRLGVAATDLQRSMLGSQSIDDATAAVDNDPQAFFLKASTTVEKDLIAEFHETPLWILGQRYPSALLDLSAQVPSAMKPETQIHLIVSHVAESKLSREQKRAALVGMCERMKSSLRQRYVLQKLAVIDQDACLKLVLPLLANLPRDVDEPYWTCEAASFTHVVMQIERDSIWRDYLGIAKRAAVGLRMEMMNPMNYAYVGDKNRQRRLAFLAAFLDDTTVRDTKINASKYEGPHAGFTFDKIEVRDFVAMQIGAILGVGDRPTEYWDAGQWSRYREKVQQSLSQETLPDLARSSVGENRVEESDRQ